MNRVKWIFAFVLALSLAPASGLMAQNGTAARAISQEFPGVSSALERVRTAFEAGDVDALMRQSANRVDVTFFNDTKLLSRSQAKYVMKDFFREYRPQRLTLQESSGAEGNWFAAANYWYKNGDMPLAVYMRLRMSGGEWELREIRIARRAQP